MPRLSLHNPSKHDTRLTEQGLAQVEVEECRKLLKEKETQISAEVNLLARHRNRQLCQTTSNRVDAFR